MSAGKKKASPPDLEPYYHNAVILLRESVDQWKRGKRAYCNVAAMQLRLLTCDAAFRHDRVEDIALLPCLRPDGLYTRLLSDGSSDLAGEKLPLAEWLDQVFEMKACAESLTARQIIRRFCDQEGGAHVDPHPVQRKTPAAELQEWVMLLAERILGDIELKTEDC